MGSITRFKGKKDYTNIFELDIIIISVKGEKIIILTTPIIIKITKKLKFPNLINIMVNRRNLSFNFFSLLYGSGITILLLKEKNKLSILPV